jgi:hypothetical protein
LGKHGWLHGRQVSGTLIPAVLILMAFFLSGVAMSAEGYTLYFPLVSRMPTLTATPTSTPTLTARPTNTQRPPVPPSATPLPTSTGTPAPTATRTQSPVPTTTRTATPTLP